MKGAADILQAVLLAGLIIASLALVIPWAMDFLEKSGDMSEAATIRNQLEMCNDRIIETARTGTAKTCIFSVRRGNLNIQEDGIYYNLDSRNQQLCDRHSWIEINPEKHIWQKCETIDEFKSLYLNWYWPTNVTMEGSSMTGAIERDNSIIDNINFNDPVVFRTLTVFIKFDFIPGQVGNILELSRAAITSQDVTIRVNLR